MIQKGLTDKTDMVVLPESKGIETLTKASKETDLMRIIWGLDNKSVVQEVANAKRMFSSKHGMFASIPILCRDSDCKYKEVCIIKKKQRIIGKRCLMEVGAIIARFDQYCDKFNIDSSSEEFRGEDLVDATLIKDLINIEISMLRAENKIAVNGDFLAETLLEIDKKCNPYFGVTVSPESHYLLTLQDKKTKILNQLNSTRKDMAHSKVNTGVGEAAAKLFQQMRTAMNTNQVQDITEMDFDDDGIETIYCEEESKDPKFMDMMQDASKKVESEVEF